MKKDHLASLPNEKKKKLKKALNKGLGPLLDKWGKAFKKFPNYNEKEVSKTGNEISDIIRDYKGIVKDVLHGSQQCMVFVGLLDFICLELERQEQWYETNK